LEQIFNIKRKLNYVHDVSKKITTKQELVMRSLFQESISIFIRSHPKALLTEFSRLLYQCFNLDTVSLYAANHEGKMIKIFTDSQSGISPRDPFERSYQESNFKNNFSSAKGQANTSKFIGNIILPIKLISPETGNEIGLLELEKVTFDGQASMNDYVDNPNELLAMDKYNINSLPEIITDFLASFSLLILQRLEENSQPNLEENIEVLKAQISNFEILNRSLQEKLNNLELIYEFHLKLKNCSSFEDIVILFNEIVTKTHLNIDLAALFFVHPNLQSYFSFNFLSSFNKSARQNTMENNSIFTDPLVTINKGESLLAKIFESLQGHSIANINVDTLMQSGSFKSSSYVKIFNGIKASDFEKEGVLIHFETGSHQSDPEGLYNTQTFKPKQYPQNILVVPVVIDDKPLAYLTIGQYGIENPYGQVEENFMKELAQALENYLQEQAKVNNSISMLNSKLQKSQIKSSKMKAYQSLIFNQNLRPEYAVYKKHKNLQSFVAFLESTYAGLLNAQHCRILLYNESRNSLYHYVNHTSTKIKEYQQEVTNSITGLVIQKNESYIYPQPSQDDINITTEDDVSETLMSFRSASKSMLKSKAHASFHFEYPGQGKENQSPHQQHNESMNFSITNSSLLQNPIYLHQAFEKHEMYNPYLDITEALANEKREVSPQSKTRSVSPPQKNQRKVQTAVFYPITNSENKIVGVVQVFNRKDPKKPFTKKDLLKVSAITEGIMPKLTRLLSGPEKLISRNYTTALNSLTQYVKMYRRKTIRDSFDKIKLEITNQMLQERRKKEMVGGFNILDIIYNQRLRKIFETLKISTIVGRYQSQQEMISQADLEYKQKMATKIAFTLVKKIELKDKSRWFKRWYDTILMESWRNQDESRLEEISRMKLIVFKNWLVKYELQAKGAAFRQLKSYKTGAIPNSKFEYQRNKLFSHILTKVFQNKQREFIMALRENLKNSKHEKAILKSFLNNIDFSNYSLYTFFNTINKYLHEVFPTLAGNNIAFIDCSKEVVFRFNSESLHKIKNGTTNKKFFSSFAKIAEKGSLTSSNTVNIMFKYFNSIEIII